MKYVLILLLAITFTNCSTVKQAQTDFSNFQKTIELNAGRPVVHKNAYYWLTCPSLQLRINIVMSTKQIEQLKKKIDKLQYKIEATKSKLDGELNELYHMTVSLYDVIEQSEKKSVKK